MKETLRLYAHCDGDPDRTAEVEYVRVPHYLERLGRNLTAYDVIVDGERAGRIEQVSYTASTTYAGTRLRRDLGKRVEWSWKAKGRGGRENYPGLYARTRRSAVAQMLGYVLDTRPRARA